MKKIIPLLLCASFALNGCFISRMFTKKEKYGCPTNGRNVGAEKILAGDKIKKEKFRGTTSVTGNQ